MRKLSGIIRRLENVISFTALTVLVASVLWGVMTRYVTERPAVWTTELSGILFTWVVFIGAMTALRDGRHIRVTLLIDILPGWTRKWVLRFGDLLVFAFLAYVTYLSIVMMGKGATRSSPVLDIPFSLVYLATVICFLGMSIISFLRLVGLAEHPSGDQVEEIL